jgi:hypothetical protein
MSLLWIGLRRRLPHLYMETVIASGTRTLLAAGVGAVGAWLAARALAGFTGAGPWLRAVPGIAASLVFVLLFFVAAWIVRSEELGALRDAVRRRRA